VACNPVSASILTAADEASMRIVLRIVRLLLDEGPGVILTTVYVVPFRRAETRPVDYKLDTCFC